MNRRNSVREWIASMNSPDLQTAHRVQRSLDAGLHGRLPEPEVTESDWGDLMPMDRALFGDAFQDTVPPAQEAAA